MRTTLLFIAFLLFFSVDLHAQEEIRITTFYPSPNGSYNQLQAQRLGVGDVDNNGTFNAADIPTTDGDVWIKGKVGIGTTGPEGKLHIIKNTANSGDEGDYAIKIEGVQDGDIGLLMGADSVRNVSYIHSYDPNTGWDRNLILQERAGNVGIGTVSPAYKLHVVKDGWKARFSGSDGYIDIGPANSGWAHIYTDRPNFIFNTPVWSIGNAFSSYAAGDLSLQTNGVTRIFARNSDGYVGIGTEAPGVKLDVAGTVRGLSLIATGLGTGQVCANAGTLGLCAPSSRKFKTDIQDLDVDVLEVLKLRPVSFKWKDSGQPDIGLIAEEVNDTVGNLATYNKDGEINGVKYEKVAVYLLKVVQQQQQQIDKLAAEIEALKKAKQ